VSVTRLVVVSGGTEAREAVSDALREGRDAAKTDLLTLTVLMPVGEGPDGIDRTAVDSVRTEIEAVVEEERFDGLTIETATIDLPAQSAAAAIEALPEWLPSDTIRLPLAPEFEEPTLSRLSTALDASERPTRVTVEQAPGGRSSADHP
jgi:hypothetical protein